MSRSNARLRQRATGEKYMVALMHVQAQCPKCKKAALVGPADPMSDLRPCLGCITYEPCWDCRPICGAMAHSHGARMVGRCQFDDLQPDKTKKCVYCTNVWPPTSLLDRKQP